MPLQHEFYGITVTITDGEVVQLTLMGDAHLDDGKNQMKKRFTINVPADDLSDTEKGFIDEFRSRVVMPVFNRVRNKDDGGQEL